jgi:hypothetical protein
MRAARLALPALIALVIALPQHIEAQGRTLAFVYEVTVKAGAAPGFEAAVKELNEFRSSHGDSWTWNVYQVMFGRDVGNYIIRSGDHAWADMDVYGASDLNALVGAQIGATIGPLVESVTSRVSGSVEELSYPADDPGSMNVFAVTEFVLDPTAAAGFEQGIAQFKEAVMASGYDLRWGYSRLLAGGSGNSVSIVGLSPSFAGLEQSDAEVQAMLVEHFGEEGAQELFETVFAAVESSETSIVMRRPDLSYSGS